MLIFFPLIVSDMNQLGEYDLQLDISAILLWLKIFILCISKGKWAASYQDTLQTTATSSVCILNIKSASVRVSSTTNTIALGRRRAEKGRFHIQNVKPCWRMIEGPVSVEEQKEPFLGLKWSSTTPCWTIWPTQKRLKKCLELNIVEIF